VVTLTAIPSGAGRIAVQRGVVEQVVDGQAQPRRIPAYPGGSRPTPAYPGGSRPTPADPGLPRPVGNAAGMLTARQATPTRPAIRRPAALRFGCSDLLGPTAILSAVVVIAIWVADQGLASLTSTGNRFGSIGLLTGLISWHLVILQALLLARVPGAEHAWGHDLLTTDDTEPDDTEPDDTGAGRQSDAAALRRLVPTSPMPTSSSAGRHGGLPRYAGPRQRPAPAAATSIPKTCVVTTAGHQPSGEHPPCAR
jgi:hypothetical protein